MTRFSMLFSLVLFSLIAKSQYQQLDSIEVGWTRGIVKTPNGDFKIFHHDIGQLPMKVSTLDSSYSFLHSHVYSNEIISMIEDKQGGFKYAGGYKFFGTNFKNKIVKYSPTLIPIDSVIFATPNFRSSIYNIYLKQALYTIGTAIDTLTSKIYLEANQLDTGLTPKFSFRHAMNTSGVMIDFPDFTSMGNRKIITYNDFPTSLKTKILVLDSNMQLIDSLQAKSNIYHSPISDSLYIESNGLAISDNKNFYLAGTSFYMGNNLVFEQGSHDRILLLKYDSLMRRTGSLVIGKIDTSNQIHFSQYFFQNDSSLFVAGILNAYSGDAYNFIDRRSYTAFQIFEVDKQSFTLKRTIRKYVPYFMISTGCMLDTNKGILFTGNYFTDSSRWGTDSLTFFSYFLPFNSQATGLKDYPLSDVFDFTFYPNPSTGIFTFRHFNGAAQYQIRIYDQQGKLVDAFKTTNPTEQINLSKQPAGLYFYHLQDENGRSATGKLVLNGG